MTRTTSVFNKRNVKRIHLNKLDKPSPGLVANWRIPHHSHRCARSHVPYPSPHEYGCAGFHARCRGSHASPWNSSTPSWRRTSRSTNCCSPHHSSSLEPVGEDMCFHMIRSRTKDQNRRCCQQLSQAPFKAKGTTNHKEPV